MLVIGLALVEDAAKLPSIFKLHPQVWHHEMHRDAVVLSLSGTFRLAELQDKISVAISQSLLHLHMALLQKSSA